MSKMHPRGRSAARYIAAALLSLASLSASWSAAAAGYFAQAGKLYDANGQEVVLHGISHFGFNTTILQPQYLWQMGWKQQIAQMKALGFNAVRVPFVPDTLYNTTPVDRLSYMDPGLNAELLGKTPLQALDLWMAEADRQGMYVLLDFHSVSMQRQYPTWFVDTPADYGLLYNKQAYTLQDWTRDLALVARRYASLPHFIGIDLYNEPNGIVRWSAGDVNMTTAKYYWKPAAEAGAAAVLAANPNLLVFVQGINGNYDGREQALPMNWGEDFQPQAYAPLNIPAAKLVLSPHTYGPDVYVKSSFSAANFPANLAGGWDALFGQFSQVHPVVVGEWGGRYGSGNGGQADVKWQDAFVSYLAARGMTSGFYWCYTPNSGDTGGILDDALAVRQDKLAMLRKLWAVTPATTSAVSAPAPAPASPPAPAPTGTLPQPGIMNFSPASGAAGTVITVNGSGFSGSTTASVGAARNATLQVLSDTQVRVTVPAGATTGAVGIFNATHAAFSATAFTLGAAPVTGLRQPGIVNFTPLYGGVGTVVTVNGSGFSGATRAWVGAAHNATLRVLSDRQVQVTVPAGATIGAIGIFNASYAAFSPTAFQFR